MRKTRKFIADVVWEIGSMWHRLGRGFQLVGGWIQHQSFKISND